MKALALFFSFSCLAWAFNPSADELSKYENTRTLDLKAEQSIETFQPQVGIWTTERDSSGRSLSGRIRVLSDNPHNDIWVIGPFNDWGRNLRADDQLHSQPQSPYFEGRIRELTHAMPYRLKVNGEELLDPASTLYTSLEYLKKFGGRDASSKLNSVYWDFNRPGSYAPKSPSTDLRGKFVAIAEEEVFELVRKWSCRGQIGPKQKADTYQFVAESGVIEELKRMGYNAIELLPFNSSVDGDSWDKRYLVYGLYGPDSRYGTPDEFRKMVDGFNQAGIAVIMDAVIGHYPFKGNSGDRDLSTIGLHRWKKSDGNPLFGSVPTPWDTYRYDYANPYIRRFLVDAVLKMLKDYSLSGIRIDNLDGIRLYAGPGGGGPEFIRELATEIRRYRPETLVIGEMFFPYAPVLERLDKNGLGINVRSHSDLFDFFKDNLLNYTEKTDVSRAVDAIRGPWSWGELPRFNYITNHDESANPRGGATGAYVASLLKAGGESIVKGKTKAFSSLAMLSAAIYLDMPQLRLLQEGSFYSNAGLDWSLRDGQGPKQIQDYFSCLSWAMRGANAFAFPNWHPDVINHVDNDNKVLSLLRIDFETGKKFYALINLGHHELKNYVFGVASENPFTILVDSDRKEFGGTHQLATQVPAGILQPSAPSMHGKPHSLAIPYLAPYGVLLLEEKI